MASILDNADSYEQSYGYNTYTDADGTFVIEFLEEPPLINSIEEPVSVDGIDTENPALVEFRSLLFDQVYHQLDIREWVC